MTKNRFDYAIQSIKLAVLVDADRAKVAAHLVSMIIKRYPEMQIDGDFFSVNGLTPIEGVSILVAGDVITTAFGGSEFTFNLLDTVTAFSFLPGDIYALALAMLRDINKESSVPNVPYVEIDRETTLADALNLILEIN